MDELQPTPMIQGEHVWLRAMESRDLEPLREIATTWKSVTWQATISHRV